MPDISDLPFTIDALRSAYGAGLSPAEVVDEVHRRLATADDPGIFIALVPPVELKSQAKALGEHDTARSLWGIPIAVKDNIDVAGLTTTAGCPAYAYWPDADAEVVAKLRAAGALIVGKTNLDQFATGLVGTRTPYSAPRNAIDPAVVPGGSSSGSAVVVSRGIVAAALGTDTAGSGRVPAALNNIVGLKPTPGLVSTRGVVPACRSLDCVSVFAHTVDDAWSVHEAIAGYDAADPFSIDRVVGPARHVRRIGVPDPASRVFSDAGYEAAFDDAVAAIEALGAEIVPLDLSDFFAVADLLYGDAWIAERYAAVGPFVDERPDEVLEVTRSIILAAGRHSAAGAFNAMHRLRELARQTEGTWREIDLLCVPSIPGPVRVDEIAADPIAPNMRLGTYTNFVNLLGLSALAVPAGRCADGFPAGVTLIGEGGEDATLAAFGRGLHARTTRTLGATSWPLPEVDQELRTEPSEGVDLLVLGAHLRGLPLNGDLLACAASFVEDAATAADYRLHLIDGGVPRPGLVRCAAGTGVAVVGEIWHLPPDGFGRFIKKITPPLSIGWVALDDGRQVLGFLAEAEGVRDAPDISRHGGWRAYLSATAKGEAKATG